MTTTTSTARKSLIAKFGDRYGIEPDRMLTTMKQTAFRQKDGEVTNEQLAALLIVADQYGLNPFTREIYAFPDKGGVVPVVGLDGWLRIINEHPQLDGMEFIEAEGDSPAWCEAVIYRKDRSHPVRAREYMAECRRDTPPWRSHPRRMLRHKSLIQCARMAFGFAGIHDADDAALIAEAGAAPPLPADSTPRDPVGDINASLAARRRGAQTVEVVEPRDGDAPALTGEAIADRLQAADSLEALQAAANHIGLVADASVREGLLAMHREVLWRIHDQARP